MANNEKDFGLTKAGTKRKREAREDEGRPSVYEERFLLNEEKQKEVLESYSIGGSDVKAMMILEIARSVFEDWLEDKSKPEFRGTIEKGRISSQAHWEDKGEFGMVGNAINPAIYCFLMKNRFRKDYGERSQVNHDHKHSGKIELPIVNRKYISMDEHKKEMKVVEESKDGD